MIEQLSGRIARTCKGCGAAFTAWRSTVQRGKGTYCSRLCSARHCRGSAAERFWAKVDKHGPIPAHRPDLGPCWLWLASCLGNGYGHWYDGQRFRVAHHVTYEWGIGPVPSELDADHLCRVRRCCNPHHIEFVTVKENLRRGVRIGVFGSSQEECIHGHPLHGDNLYVEPTGTKSCRICYRAAGAKWRAQNRERDRARHRAQYAARQARTDGATTAACAERAEGPRA